MYCGTVSLYFGEQFSAYGFSLYGMAQIRNEKRFNQGIFPNHNWRGLIGISYDINSLVKQLPLNLYITLEHESAHPTMGIVSTISNKFERVYDSSYRRYLLNSLQTTFSRELLFNSSVVLININYMFYFLSKNTPELYGMEDALGNGISGGFEFRKILKRIIIFGALFDRFIFTGSRQSSKGVYVSANQLSTDPYLVLNRVTTFESKIGIYFIIGKIKRNLNVYYSFTHGNIYGFVDSREKRFVNSIGFEFHTLEKIK